MGDIMDKTKIIAGVAAVLITIGVIFYYQNNLVTYSVIFDTQAGAGYKTQEIKRGDKVENPGIPRLQDYEFLGWYLGDEKYNFDTPVTKSMTLTAKWKKIDEEVEEVENSYYSTLSGIGQAKLSAFALEANEIINSATTYWTNETLKKKDGLPSVGEIKCVNISTLIDKKYLDFSKYSDGKGYSGIIQVTKSKDNVFLYKLWVQKDHEYAIVGKGNDGKNNTYITGEDIIMYEDGIDENWITKDNKTCPSGLD